MPSKNLIDVTVALPLWSMRDISWIQLESLCRQQTEFKWELIVCEEQLEDYVGEGNISSYADRLSQAGCKSITYLPLYERVPLAKKWTLIAEKARGLTYILAGGDDYSPFDRIQFTHQIMTAGNYDWFDVAKGLFYDINTGETCTYDHGLSLGSALCMAIRTRILKSLIPYLYDCATFWPSNAVDNWMRTKVGKICSNKFYTHPYELEAVDTDGYNKISSDRTGYYENKAYRHPFRAPTQRLEDVLPPDIYSRLTQMTFNRILTQENI